MGTYREYEGALDATGMRIAIVAGRFNDHITTPLLEGLEIDGRIAVVLSPYDIGCALERGASLECKGYIPADAAKIGANVLLYALQQ